MREMLEHPDITSALKTGYPSKTQATEIDCDPDEDALYDEQREAAHGW